MDNNCSSKISERNPIENGLTDTDEITLHGMAMKRDVDIDTIKYMLDWDDNPKNQEEE